MTLSILIVNWKSTDYLQRCLQSIDATCQGLSPQIVVADGGSFDGCGEMLAANFPHVEFVQSPDNVGFGRSNNLGFAKVTGEALLLLNPDTELRGNVVQVLMTQLQELPQAGLLGPRLLNSNGSLQTSCVQAFATPLNRCLDSEFLRRLFPGSSLWGVYEAFSARQSVEVDAVSGACMLLRSEIFRQLEGFDPRYFMYGEDMDLCYRVRQLGLKVYHAPMVEVVHHGGGSSSGAFSKRSAVHQRESTYRFIQSHRGSGAALSYRFLMGVSALIRLPLLLLGYAFSRSSKRAAHGISLRKWVATLRWCVDLEKAGGA